tara:strand:+ start:817 stop:978 length:162 start_codon:yes stop_codon:yes gene_type:complete
MKVIIWIYEDDLDKLLSGDLVDYFAANNYIGNLIQVIVDTDTYQQLKDRNENE